MLVSGAEGGEELGLARQVLEAPGQVRVDHGEGILRNGQPVLVLVERAVVIASSALGLAGIAVAFGSGEGELSTGKLLGSGGQHRCPWWPARTQVGHELAGEHLVNQAALPHRELPELLQDVGFAPISVAGRRRGHGMAEDERPLAATHRLVG
jgi:hypothetical protein